jgi:aminoglycoside/choline kinase family phosphotransferase
LTGQFTQLISDKIAASFGAATALASLTPLAGDASSRRYYRALLKGAGAPSSAIVMELPAGSSLPLSSEELAVFKEAPKELPFLNLHRFLSRIGVRVPRLFGHWEKEGILLLEDLGDIALWDRVQGLPASEVLSWYRKAIDELLVLQVRGTRQRDDACVAFQQRFDFRLYMWEFEHFLEYGLIKRPDVRVGQSTVDHLRNIFTDIAARLDRQPSCLNHRDFHSWNLMIHDDAVAVIDFQDALLAPPQYDLASLLNDRITDTVIEPDLESALLRYYLDKRAEAEKRPIEGDEFIEIYLLSAIQRDLKVVGRFFYLDLVKGKPGYKKFIPPTVRRLKRNLTRLPQTESIIAPLAEHFEEMR